MTHEEFWLLYDTNQIKVKIYSGTIDGIEKSIEAFEYNNKFYLRIHTHYEFLSHSNKAGNRYRLSQDSNYIKEFKTKQQANNYFKKAGAGLTRVS